MHLHLKYNFKGEYQHGSKNQRKTTEPIEAVKVETKEVKAGDIKPKRRVPVAQEFARKGEKLRENLSEDAKAIEGTWSDKLYAVPLVQTNFLKEPLLVEKSHRKLIVGYAVKGEIDFEVEEVINGVVEVRPVKAGETVNLTREEIGLLASRPEVACVIGDKKLTLRTSKGKGLTPALISMTKVAMKSQMTIIDKKEGDKWVCLPEYEEKFGHLYRRVRGQGLGGRVSTPSDPAKKREIEKNIAAGLRSYYSAKLSASPKK